MQKTKNNLQFGMEEGVQEKTYQQWHIMFY